MVDRYIDIYGLGKIKHKLDKRAKSRFYGKVDTATDRMLAEVDVSCPTSAHKWRQSMRDVFDGDASWEITINGFPTVASDSDVRRRDALCVARAIYKYNKDTKREVQPVIMLVYEHASKYHCHGMIEGAPADLIDYIRRFCRRTLGRTEIKPVKHFESYCDYMWKSYLSRTQLVEHFDAHDITTFNYIDKMKEEERGESMPIRPMAKKKERWPTRTEISLPSSDDEKNHSPL